MRNLILISLLFLSPVVFATCSDGKGECVEVKVVAIAATTDNIWRSWVPDLSTTLRYDVQPWINVEINLSTGFKAGESANFEPINQRLIYTITCSKCLDDSDVLDAAAKENELRGGSKSIEVWVGNKLWRVSFSAKIVASVTGGTGGVNGTLQTVPGYTTVQLRAPKGLPNDMNLSDGQLAMAARRSKGDSHGGGSGGGGGYIN